jgi:hypothetical protein
MQMKSLELGRYALNSCVAAAMLAGCGGSQPPIGAQGAMPQGQTFAIAAHSERGGSWMLPEAESASMDRTGLSSLRSYIYYDN